MKKLIAVKRTSQNLTANQRGSLALEQVLFIGAVVALSAGLYVFYNNMAGYFSGISFSSSPANVGSNTAPTLGTTP